MTLEELVKTHNWNLGLFCPVCSGKLVLSENHKQLTCSNEFCTSRSSGNISKWSDKLKIKELGLTTIEKIQDLGYFKTISSIYSDMKDLTVNSEMVSLLGKNWENIKKEIKSHQTITLSQFISGYNIPGLGEKQIQRIIDSFGFTTLNDFIGTNPDRFICDGIGSIISRKLHEGLEVNLPDMEKTLSYITIMSKQVKSGCFSGMSFCFTGSMDKPRKELQKLVEQNGGINFDSVKKGLTYLVIQDPNSTSSKAVKARTLGITLISPEQFINMAKSI